MIVLLLTRLRGVYSACDIYSAFYISNRRHHKVCRYQRYLRILFITIFWLERNMMSDSRYHALRADWLKPKILASTCSPVSQPISFAEQRVCWKYLSIFYLAIQREKISHNYTKATRAFWSELSHRQRAIFNAENNDNITYFYSKLAIY